MAIIKKKIENLKPGKEYVLTVRAKNSDLNVLSDYSDSIRFQVPNDTTTPSALTNLQLFAGMENVMFVFDYSQDLDVRRYEYELYQNSNMSDEGGPLTGFADANVFTVRVSNLQLEEDGSGLAPFWGRARTIDTTGNVGPWTSLVQTDPHTPLIDNQYIGSLTASKITAGTIGAHTINLNGVNSIIQSTTYEDTSGTQGWQIRGDGHFSLGGPNGITYDNDSISIGSDVSVTATLSADSITVGTAPNQLKINGAINGGAGGMTIGDPTYNYWYSNGYFRAGGLTNYILWNGSSLSVSGTINILSGTIDGSATINGTSVSVIETATVDFNSRNNRNSTTPTSPSILSDGTAVDHTINTDGSADISFEWNYTYSDSFGVANNIDGFIVYLYSSTSSSPYTFGTTPALESTYPVNYDQRAIIFSGVAADKYYTFGVRAYRVVDSDVDSNQILFSSIVKSSAAGENPYQPSSSIAFAGNITGTVNSVAVATVTTAVFNFNSNNDRKSTTPATPTSVAFGTAIFNTNASIDLPLTWTFAGTGDAYDIDGFVIFLKTTTTTNPNNITTSDLNTNIQQIYLTAEKRSHTFSGISPSSFYRAAIRAYRVVDTDINSAGIIYGSLTNTAERSSATAILGGSSGISIGNGKIYIGTGTFNNANTGFYVDSDGQFSLKNKLAWDGTTLTVTGSITGSTVTGSTLTTASSGNRVEIRSNDIYLYNTVSSATSIQFDGASSAFGVITSLNAGVQITAPTAGNVRYTVGDAYGYAAFKWSYVSGSSDIPMLSLNRSTGSTVLTVSGTVSASDNVNAAQMQLTGSSAGYYQYDRSNQAVNWTTYVDGGFYRIYNSVFADRLALSSNDLYIYTLQVNAGGSALRYIAGGQVTAAASKRSLKNNIDYNITGLSIINKLKPASFTWKKTEMESEEVGKIKALHKNYGFIAEDIAEADGAIAVLEPVINENMTQEEKVNSYRNIDSWIPSYYSETGILALAVKSIQELSERLEILENK
jgi:hypothetical protein